MTDLFIVLYDISVNDHRLSDSEFGMLIYLIEKLDREQIDELKRENLAKRFNISKELAGKRLRKLIEFGYIKRNRLRNPAGGFGPVKLQLTVPEAYLASNVIPIGKALKGKNK